MKVKTFTRLLISLTTLTALIACGAPAGNTGGGNAPVATLEVAGVVQKGPFIEGTNITIRELDETLKPTGRTFTAAVNSNTGAFSGRGTLMSPYAELSANGFYFDETTGNLSNAQLTLNAVVDLSSTSAVNINILTHLESERIYQLFDTGLTFTQAKQQAQTELFTALAPGISSGDASSETLNIGAPGEANGFLLAISATLQQGRNVAQLTQFLAQLSNDFRENGIINIPANRAAITERARLVNRSQVRSNLEAHYSELGLEVDLPNFEEFLREGWELGTSNQLTLSTQPSSTTINNEPLTQQPVIQLRDANGNPISQADITITATIANNNGTLAGDTTVTNAAGQAEFTGLTITGLTGDYTLTFTAENFTSTTSQAITLTAGPARQLTLTTQPSSTTINNEPLTQQPTVQLRDISGNPVSQEGVTITATIGSGEGVLSGTTTATTSVAGQAEFTNLTITGLVGNQTFTFTAGELTSITSQIISLTAGAASQLALTTDPSRVVATAGVFSQQPIVQLLDASGNPVNQAGLVVTAAIGLGGGVLSGAANVTTDLNGEARFANLAVSDAVGAVTLTFASEGVGGIAAPPIEVGRALSGLVSGTETWSGLIIVTGDVRILSDANVTVLEGTRIYVDGREARPQVLVEGILSILGTEASPVRIRAIDTTTGRGRWHGLSFRNTSVSVGNESGWVSGSQIHHAIIEDADTAVYVHNQGFTIKSVVFNSNRYAIELRATDGVHISDSTFTQNQHGIWTEYEPIGGYGDFLNTWILSNRFISNNVAVEFNPNQRATNNLNIRGNWFEDNNSAVRWGGGGYGIRDAIPLTISENRFWANGIGIFMQAYGGNFDISITDNAFGDNGIALQLSHGYEDFRIQNNFFYRNTTTISVMAAWLTVDIDNNLIYQDENFLNFQRWDLYPEKRVTVTRNLFDGLSGRLLELRSLRALSFDDNVVQGMTSSAPWIIHEAAINLNFDRNYIDWMGLSAEQRVLDGRTNVNYGLVQFNSPLASPADSTSGRNAAEIPGLINLFVDGMDRGVRSGPRK